MINMTVDSPEQLWVALGAAFFQKKRPEFIIDYAIASRRFFSFNNTLVVKEWPKGWDNPELFDIVGYSDVGTKMKSLTNTYLNRDKWDEFRGSLEDYNINTRTSGIKTFGVNFNLKPQGKGGCLSSFHLIQHDKEIDIIVHLKVAELPRKFLADLRFISYLITNLDLPQESYKVTFMLSSLYFSIIGLRAYIPILGKKTMDMQGLPIDEHRNYQVGVQEGIYAARERFFKRYGPQTMEYGISYEDLINGRTKCTKDQIEQPISCS